MIGAGLEKPDSACSVSMTPDTSSTTTAPSKVAAGASQSLAITTTAATMVASVSQASQAMLLPG